MKSTSRSPAANLLCAYFAMALILCIVVPARAQTWTGNLSTDWYYPQNWSSNPSAPASSNDTSLFFGPASLNGTSLVQNLNPSGSGSGEAFVLNSITFNSNAPDYTIGGSALDFRTSSNLLIPPQIVQNSASGITFNNPFTLTSTLSVFQSQFNGSVSLNGVLSGPGGLTINANPNGGVGLGGANTFTGPINVNSGPLVLGNDQAIPTGGTVNVASGGLLFAGFHGNTAATAIGTLTLNGGTFVPRGFDGDYFLNRLSMNEGSAVPTVNFAGDGTLHFVNFGAAVNVVGNANWTVGGTSRIVNDTATTMDINVSNGTLTSSVNLANGANGQGFQVNGNGTLALTNLGNTANLAVANGATISVTDMAYLGTGSLSVADSAPGTIQYAGDSASSAKPIALGIRGGTIYVSKPGTNLTLTGVISGSSSSQPLIIRGAAGGSTVTLAANNTYVGPTIITDGATLSIDSSSGLSTPIGTSNGLPRNLQIGGGGGSGGTLQLTGGSNNTAHGITLNGPSQTAIEITAPQTTFTVGGQITGAGALTKLGPGTLTLTNPSNNWSGGTFVNAGQLMIGGSTVLPPAKDVTVSSAAQLILGNFSNSLSTALGTLALNGGEFRATETGNYYINKLTTDAKGGTLFNQRGSGFNLFFVNPGAAMSINGDSNWTAGLNLTSGLIINASPGSLNLNIAPFVTLTNSTILAGGDFLITGGGFLDQQSAGSSANLTISNNATLGIHELSALTSGNVTLNGGGIDFFGASGTINKTLSIAGNSSLILRGSDTTLNLAGQISGTGGLTLRGLGTLILSGNNSFAGGITIDLLSTIETDADERLGTGNVTIHQAGTLRYTSTVSTTRSFLSEGMIDLGGHTLELRGGLLVNNGFINGTVNIKSGSLAKGGGTYGPVNVSDGGRFSPGSSPGAFYPVHSVTTGATTWGPGGAYLFEINDAAGAASDSWDLWNINGGLSTTAGTSTNSRFTLSIASLTGDNSPGNAANFDSTQNYSWLIASTTSGITGFETAQFTLDSTTFTNSIGGGSFSLSQTGNDLFLNFNGAPTPAQWNIDASGSWATASNWLAASVPNGPTASAHFLGKITAPRTITLDGDKQVQQITFDNPNTYTIAQGSGGTLTIGDGTSGSIIVRSGSHEISAPVAFSGNITTTGDGALTISGPVGGQGSLNKAGPALLTLSGSNSYSGVTSVQEGTLRLRNNSALGAGGASVAVGAALEMQQSTAGSAIDVAQGVQLSGDGVSGGGALRNVSGNNRLSGAVTLLANSSIGSDADTLTIPSGISGAFALTKVGPGTLILAGSNTYTGRTTVSGGVLFVAGFGALPATSSTTVDHATLRIDNPSNLPSAPITLTNGTLQYSGPSTTIDRPFILSSDGSFDVTNPDTILSFYSPITGPGRFIKTGRGTLIAGFGRNFSNPITIDDGRIDVYVDDNLGTSNITINPRGVMRFNSTVLTSRSFTLNGGTLESPTAGSLALHNALVTGGFLRGTGTFQIQGNTSIAGTTALAGTQINQVGSASLINFTNSGFLASSAPLTWSGGSNTGSGHLTVSSSLTTSAFENNGVVNIQSGGVWTHTDNFLTSTGGSRITVNPGGTMTLLGNQLDLNGALLVNNGTINGITSVNFGSLAKGSGVYGAVNVTDGGKFSPGNSPGSATTGSATWNSGGSYVVEIADALAGPGSGWDTWNVNGALALSATNTTNGRFSISLSSMDALAANFDPHLDYNWIILHATDAITGFDPADINLDASAFKNSLAGGNFSLQSTANDLIIHFSAVPESGFLTVLAAMSIFALHRRRIRK